MEGALEHGGRTGSGIGNSTGKRRAFIGGDAGGGNSPGRERNADGGQDGGAPFAGGSYEGYDGSLGENPGSTGGNADVFIADGGIDEQDGSSGNENGGSPQAEGKRRRGRPRKSETEKTEVSVTDEWAKVPYVPTQEGGEGGYPRKSYPKKVKDAKVTIYSKVILGTHKGLSSILGPEAMIEETDAQAIAEAYVVCEEYYGWNMLEKWMPIMGLLTTVVAVEGPIIKKLALPKKTNVEGKIPISVPKLVKS